MTYLRSLATIAPAFAPLFQAEEGGSGIPWWAWVGIIAVILLILFIGFVLFQEPGPPLPKEEDEPEPSAGKEPEEKAEPEVAPAAEPEVQTRTTGVEPVVASEQVVAEATTEAAPAQEPAPDPAESEKEAAAPVPSGPAQADDLKRIEGIGPKISSLLNEAGISTFAQLAATPVEKLDKILDEAGIHMAHPGTWPEQSRLAAEGKWEELEKMQEGMKGGRRS